MSSRRGTLEQPAASARPLRIVASGTLFVTHTLSVPAIPTPSGPSSMVTARAYSVTHNRGGSASTVLSMLAQYPNVEAMLIAPLSGDDEGQGILRDLRSERVNTKYARVWDDLGVPSAWVVQAEHDDSRSVINHNPLPEITHEDFVSLLGPLLAPENYAQTSPNNSYSSQSGPPLPLNMRSPAPFDWLHFEGRSVKTTLSNMRGVDGLARERRWRAHCVFSLDVGRKTRQGVEALIPQADVIFLNKYYAQAHSAQYAASPRAFLLSLASVAPPHALLVAYWGTEGAALLSIPTREYFQSSGWVQSTPQPTPGAHFFSTSRNGARDSMLSDGTGYGMQSVRTGSEFYAGQHTPSSSMAFTASFFNRTSGTDESFGGHPHRDSYVEDDGGDDDDAASEQTEIAGDRQAWRRRREAEAVDDAGAQEAFIAGMIWALSRRLMPRPVSPWSPIPTTGEPDDADISRWRLEECLKFATEMAGRKARMKGWKGLAEQMRQAGWVDG
ncbi:hypothetical protein PUNSTDRAFT_76888 [Punctularia strigosozonata HHB-11173 SS5]|uniref:Carbohydrate kinase PfkB domain-containing protein n=1 Tax=Punctularia strigosozonata (strain HHB-11173) TaxID=741275 RepID=R7S4M1_PUNST|nr:uncharacterized protein PUNSTDRAFT_76888 [Punctularia strigosozonata HHB-11173 SS5]EIN04196.1 hypothetical protein PUNSTDRAFT_76888 [Punctularia strigosozonata HHB-11173 SS5]